MPQYLVERKAIPVNYLNYTEIRKMGSWPHLLKLHQDQYYTTQCVVHLLSATCIPFCSGANS